MHLYLHGLTVTNLGIIRRTCPKRVFIIMAKRKTKKVRRRRRQVAAAAIVKQRSVGLKRRGKIVIPVIAMLVKKKEAGKREKRRKRVKTVPDLSRLKVRAEVLFPANLKKLIPRRVRRKEVPHLYPHRRQGVRHLP